ncbi:MAG: hypothetical protein NZ805_15925, partial [Armatimonadetes bacterium]|nr:hypothetical protein [Armatimonadota bacterium]MDW8029997.1 hypothetical protein [Armatimonadota bacterium]
CQRLLRVCFEVWAKPEAIPKPSQRRLLRFCFKVWAKWVILHTPLAQIQLHTSLNCLNLPFQ